MKCKKCGAEVMGKFCSKCGTDNSVVESKNKKVIDMLVNCRSTQGANVKWLLLDLATLLPIFICCAALWELILDEGTWVEYQACVNSLILFVLIKIMFKFNRLITMVSSFFTFQTEEQLQKLYAEESAGKKTDIPNNQEDPK